MKTFKKLLKVGAYVFALFLTVIMVAGIVWAWLPFPNYVPPDPEWALHDAIAKARREARALADSDHSLYRQQSLSSVPSAEAIPADNTADVSAPPQKD